MINLRQPFLFVMGFLIVTQWTVAHADTIRVEFNGTSSGNLPALVFFEFPSELLLAPNQVTTLTAPPFSPDPNPEITFSGGTFQRLAQQGGSTFVQTGVLSHGTGGLDGLQRATLQIQQNMVIFAEAFWHDGGGSHFFGDPTVFSTNEFPSGALGIDPAVYTGSWSKIISPTMIEPIPEPSTVLLFGSGLAGLGAWRYRKRVKS